MAPIKHLFVSTVEKSAPQMKLIHNNKKVLVLVIGSIPLLMLPKKQLLRKILKADKKREHRSAFKKRGKKKEGKKWKSRVPG